MRKTNKEIKINGFLFLSFNQNEKSTTLFELRIENVCVCLHSKARSRKRLVYLKRSSEISLSLSLSLNDANQL